MEKKSNKDHRESNRMAYGSSSLPGSVGYNKPLSIGDILKLKKMGHTKSLEHQQTVEFINHVNKHYGTSKKSKENNCSRNADASKKEGCDVAALERLKGTIRMVKL